MTVMTTGVTTVLITLTPTPTDIMDLTLIDITEVIGTAQDSEINR